MTEAEWWTSDDPDEMYTQAVGRLKCSDRRKDLFCLACARLIWDLLEADARRPFEWLEGHVGELFEGPARALRRAPPAGGRHRWGRGPRRVRLLGGLVRVRLPQPLRGLLRVPRRAPGEAPGRARRDRPRRLRQPVPPDPLPPGARRGPTPRLRSPGGCMRVATPPRCRSTSLTYWGSLLCSQNASSSRQQVAASQVSIRNRSATGARRSGRKWRASRTAVSLGRSRAGSASARTIDRLSE